MQSYIAYSAASMLSNHIPSNTATPNGASFFFIHTISLILNPLFARLFSCVILAMLCSLSSLSQTLSVEVQ